VQTEHDLKQETEMKTSLKTLTLGLAAAIGIGVAGAASAATPWEVHQQHRAQVHRHIQDRHINHLERTGRISPWEARRMHRDNHRGYYGYRPDHRSYGYNGGYYQRGYSNP
jgi:hypothetical protein